MTSGDRSSRLDHLEIPSDWPRPFTESTTIGVLPDPKTATHWTTVTSPREIEYYLLLRNRQHFGQAQGTPLTIPPLSTELDWSASSLASELILQGHYVHPPGISELCKDVLRYCRQRDASPLIGPTLSLESFWGKIRKWREATTTSPSGRHLGWYKKALFAKGNHTPDQVDEQAIFYDKQTTIAKLIITVLNYCIRSGHVLNRWKTVVNTMIFKEPGNFQIHRLRVLHIYEADFNLLMAVK